ncbi:GIY-YIG nuclease family protein [Halobellus salinisoli]|uniref:GIY-YIG nuclease family protein n=1 Tax=Halobellus salinisoli TaxID=3108500 RepID=UPI00300B42A6
MRDADAVAATDDPRLVVVDPAAIAGGTDPLGIGEGTAPPGTYVLVYSVAAPLTAEVGALGSVTFDAGACAYVGSAFGSNGLGRVDRHRRVAAGEHDVQHWHVDYVGSHPNVSLDAVVVAPHAAVECRLATELRASVDASAATASLDGFGASDCTCVSHIVAASDAGTLRSTVREAVARLVRE